MKVWSSALGHRWFVLVNLIFSIVCSKEAYQSCNQEIRWLVLWGPPSVPTDGASAYSKAAVWENISPKLVMTCNLISASICGIGSFCRHTQWAELAVDCVWLLTGIKTLTMHDKVVFFISFLALDVSDRVTKTFNEPASLDFSLMRSESLNCIHF